jgi:hypothetical protein
MSRVVTIPMLHIQKCSDPHRWYAHLVGRSVPALGHDPNNGWKSKEQAGYANYILTQDAYRFGAPVPEHMLGQWPYITHETIAAQYAQAKTAAPLQHDAPPERHITRRVVTHAPAHPAPTGQSHAHSWAEAVANIVVGFVVSLGITAVVLPAYGHHVTWAENFQITAIFTVASLLRSYGVRRFFNRLQTKGARRHDGLLQRD